MKGEAPPCRDTIEAGPPREMPPGNHPLTAGGPCFQQHRGPLLLHFPPENGIIKSKYTSKGHK